MSSYLFVFIPSFPQTLLGGSSSLASPKEKSWQDTWYVVWNQGNLERSPPITNHPALWCVHFCLRVPTALHPCRPWGEIWILICVLFLFLLSFLFLLPHYKSLRPKAEAELCVLQFPAQCLQVFLIHSRHSINTSYDLARHLAKTKD